MNRNADEKTSVSRALAARARGSHSQVCEAVQQRPLPPGKQRGGCVLRSRLGAGTGPTVKWRNGCCFGTGTWAHLGITLTCFEVPQGSVLLLGAHSAFLCPRQAGPRLPGFLSVSLLSCVPHCPCVQSSAEEEDMCPRHLCVDPCSSAACLCGAHIP